MSDSDKLKCVEREIAMRKLVYPARVKAKKMTQREAEYEIRMMEAIAHDYRAKIAFYTKAESILAGETAPPERPAEKD